MAVLERRVQVLFDTDLYARMEAEAADLHMSVGAFIRDTVDDRLRVRKVERSEALRRLFDRADEHPGLGPIDWAAEKDAWEQRESLRDLP